MKPSWQKLRNRLLGADLFDRARGKLTLQYSGVLIVFLCLFAVVVYTLLYVFIWDDQKKLLKELADSEIRTLQNWVNGGLGSPGNANRKPPREVEETFHISGEQSFYYLISDANGAVVFGDEIQPVLRTQVLERIESDRLDRKGIHSASLLLYGRPGAPAGQGAGSGGGSGTGAGSDSTAPGQSGSSGGSGGTNGRADAPRRAEFLITSRPLEIDGQRAGMLYVGKEVTFQHDLFRRLLFILIGLALAFFVLALLLSRAMSRRAIVPIAEAYARQREFAADASHELRTPLSVLLSSIETLKLEESVEENPFASKILDGMKDEVRQMTRLAGEMLTLARSDSGQLALADERFDLAAAAGETVAKLQPLAEAKQIALRLDTPAALPFRGDSEKLKQLLILLMDNAVKYTPEHGKVDVRLSEATERGRKLVVIEVRDTGIGIPAEALPRIFDRFYRIDKARSRQAGGHGLGLAIAKTIVEACRGTLRVASVEGSGTVFTVHLPISP